LQSTIVEERQEKWLRAAVASSRFQAVRIFGAHITCAVTSTSINRIDRPGQGADFLKRKMKQVGVRADQIGTRPFIRPRQERSKLKRDS
jgi:hypothetical protein